jgi:hypothetical protein
MTSFAVDTPRTIAFSVLAHRLWFSAVLFSFSIIIMPFTSILTKGNSLPVAGELNTEPYLLLIAICFPIFITELVVCRALIFSKILTYFLVCFSIVLVAGLIFNGSEIWEGAVRGRSAIGKFIASAAVVYGGFFFANLMFIIALTHLRQAFIQPLKIATLILIAGGVLEVLSWHSSLFNSIYQAIPLPRRGTELIADPNFGHRVRSVTFEPSSFGGILLFVLPWQLAWFSEARQIWKRCFWGSTIVTMAALSALSGKTAAIGLFGIVGIHLIVWFCLATNPSIAKLCGPILKYLLIGVFVIPLLFFMLFANDIGRKLALADSVSNVSRFGTVSILIDLFKQSPVFGVGMGQYGFYVPHNVPSWAVNWEFKRWVSDPTASFFPSFSGVARLAGEMGSVGLLVWIYFSITLLSKVYEAAFLARDRLGRPPIVGQTIVVGLFSMALFEWSAGGLKGINIWGTFGLAAAYLYQPLLLEQAMTQHKNRFTRRVQRSVDHSGASSVQFRKQFPGEISSNRGPATYT